MQLERIYGRDHLAPGQTHVVSLSPQVALACSAGLRPERKRDGNEDVIAILAQGEREAIVVADGHFGRRAAEIAVDSVVGDLQASGLEMTRPQAALGLLLASAQSRIAEELAPSFRKLETSPECTLLVVIRTPTHLHVGSVGDSMAMSCRRGGSLRSLVPPQRTWLGVAMALRTASPDLSGVRGAARELGIGFWWRGNAERAAAMRVSLEQAYVASVPRERDELLLVASDGLFDGRDASEERIAYALLRAYEEEAGATTRGLIESAMSQGGTDNIACALLMPRGA